MTWLLLALMACGSTASPTPADAPAADAPELRFSHECDASAAVMAGDHLIVATDEGTSLVVYRRSGPGRAPASRVDLAAPLTRALGQPLNAPKGGAPRELDLEGVAAHGDRLWWVGSHGRSKKGKDRPNRRMLFATSRPDPGGRGLDVEVLGKPRDLLPALLALPELGPVLARLDAEEVPPKQGGLDIEGLAADPTSGDLLLGLRSPLDADGRAWVLRLSGPAALLDDPEATPSLIEHARLDLGGLGIRSLLWYPRLAGYVVAAGPPGSGGPFRLYLWDGEGAPRPLEVSLGDLRPEGLVELDDGLLLISDDGGVERDGRECKDRRADRDADPGVWFRARLLPHDTLTTAK